MIKTTAMLLEELKEYAYPKSKLSRMVERGECFPITRGLYETDPNVPAHLLAGSIYGPSYISFEYALGYYGLIPEAVYTVTCATFEKKKKKKYETSFGTFTYRDVPSEAFPLGIRLIQEGDYFYRIAEPEKALCDQLYTISPVPNIKKLMRLLTEDLRIEEAELKKLDANKVCEYSEAYRTTNIKKLCSLLRRI
jgi:predicted transcriptional regulator of viral defense system